MIRIQSNHPKQKIGFITGAPSIRMEENASPYRDSDELGPAVSPLASADFKDFFGELMRERERILDKISIKDLTQKEKFRLLEENRTYMTLLIGGSRTKFRTEKVIYAMLGFSGVIILVLAWLTISKDLNPNVTTTFVGTVVGGMIATIAQKLGKVG